MHGILEVVSAQTFERVVDEYKFRHAVLRFNGLVHRGQEKVEGVTQVVPSESDKNMAQPRRTFLRVFSVACFFSPQPLLAPQARSQQETVHRCR